MVDNPIQLIAPPVPDWIGRDPVLHPFPIEPLSLQADPQGAAIVLGLAFALAALSLLRCVQLAFARRDALPVVLCLTAFAAIVIEPICDLTLGAWFPSNQVPAIEFYNRPIPLAVALLYTVYFPPTILYLTRRFETGITKAQLFRFYGATVLFCWFFEVLPLHWRIWIYHSGHPLMPLGFSFLWGVVNPTMLIFAAAAVHATRRLFPVGGAILAAVAFPMAFAGWLGISAVAGAIFNSPMAIAHPGINWIAQILALVCCVYLLSVLADMLGAACRRGDSS